MKERLFLGAYWPARRESMDACATRLFEFFQRLEPVDATFSQWFKTGNSRKEALERRVDVADKRIVHELLTRGRQYDVDGELIDDLGSIVALWNGADDDHAISLNLSCGIYSEWVSNVVGIHMPRKLGTLSKTDTMSAVLAAVARSWEPDWAGVMSDRATDLRDWHSPEPFVDWMIYMSAADRRIPSALPLPARIEPIDNLGAVIITQPDPPEPENPEHLRSIKLVEAALGIG